jgi:phosphoribosylaminoimidazolecarboxamide formyltransferase/IMP cyclohydrolase
VKIKSALISVYYKTGLEAVLKLLHEHGVSLYATGGTFDFIRNLGYEVTAVEDITHYPSILGGRVKTLHPKIFGGILHRRNVSTDLEEISTYDIPAVDLVMVDLYPFEETVKSGAAEEAVIEKIDIGGVSLIRAAAKNFNDVTIVSSPSDRELFINHYAENGETSLQLRKTLASNAFRLTSNYDHAIQQYFSGDRNNFTEELNLHLSNGKKLRYGENPHQQATFFGELSDILIQLSGKELSYNNLLDCDAALNLISEFDEKDGVTIGIIKHNNACGLATRSSSLQAWKDALAGDPVSAFGGIIVCNTTVDISLATEMKNLFFEVLIAKGIHDDALALLSEKKNRIILKLKPDATSPFTIRTALNGYLVQTKDCEAMTSADWNHITNRKPSAVEMKDLLFANKIVRNLKSNAIVLAKNQQLIGTGAGETSRIDALQHAIAKALHFGFNLKNAVMASDAFFPFPDCVEIAFNSGIEAVVQPGGSIKDKDSVEFCNKNNMTMVLTGKRHFKH